MRPPPPDRAAAVCRTRGSGVEAARREIGLGARTGAHPTVVGAVVAPLAVDDHGPGQHQFAHPALRHRRQQHRGAQVVAAHIGGGVREVLAEADHRRLVAYGVHATQCRRHRLPVPYIGVDPLPVQRRGRWCRMGGRQEGVEDDGLMAVFGEGGDDVRADEARTSGDQYTHGPDARPERAPEPASTPFRHHPVRPSGGDVVTRWSQEIRPDVAFHCDRGGHSRPPGPRPRGPRPLGIPDTYNRTRLSRPPPSTNREPHDGHHRSRGPASPQSQ